ncbi:hypothetical protein, partial [Aurantimonas coralicida]|uniref:hypothetical protein n=1 Tax=Aurantimonas coralicida TaxID=182270 RepID=UPI001D180CEB
KNLDHSASFHPCEKTAPSKPGIKHLAIWTPDFFKKPFPLINYETAKPDGWAAGPSIALDQGRYLGSVALPAAFIEAKSNPRGRPGLRAGKVSESSNGTHVAIAGVREEIEYGVARAVCIQAYRIVRFISGATEADHREVALGEAKLALLPHLAPCFPSRFIDRAKRHKMLLMPAKAPMKRLERKKVRACCPASQTT